MVAVLGGLRALSPRADGNTDWYSSAQITRSVFGEHAQCCEVAPVHLDPEAGQPFFLSASRRSFSFMALAASNLAAIWRACASRSGESGVEGLEGGLSAHIVITKSDL